MKFILSMSIIIFGLNGCYHIGYAGGIITNKAIGTIVEVKPEYNSLNLEYNYCSNKSNNYISIASATSINNNNI